MSGLSAGLMIKRSRARFPPGAGDGNLFNYNRGFSESVESVSKGFPTYSFIAHCHPLSLSHRPDVNEII